ncbi:hypothetical protein [Mycoplasma procyoni]|uniref:hypothetical protein n=1 Tax=Mycoplasma procyoni TaxID=568784 RepID=UPI00197BB503|nr:hypothetical protein [Mycoplasma procyoni]MBN3534651.1 hypothetical protein [Mycoplasma procyoni]
MSEVSNFQKINEYFKNNTNEIPLLQIYSLAQLEKTRIQSQDFNFINEKEGHRGVLKAYATPKKESDFKTVDHSLIYRFSQSKNSINNKKEEQSSNGSNTNYVVIENDRQYPTNSFVIKLNKAN